MVVFGLRIPTHAVLFKGFGESDLHPIEAFDNALLSSGVHEYNLVYYSSILPKDVEFVGLDSLKDLPRGTELPVVLSHIEGHKGEFIAAAIGRAISEDSGGIIVENRAKGPSEDELYMGVKKVSLQEFMDVTEELALRLLKVRGLEPVNGGAFYASGYVGKTYGYAVAGVAFVRFRQF